MKIGFDISQTGREKAGCGFFADSLIRHLAEIDHENEYILYPTFGNHYWDPNWVSSTCQIDQINFRRGLGHRTFEAARAFWNNPLDDFEKQLGLPDIIHSNNFFCPTNLRKTRLVYTLYDLSFLIHPEWTTEENRIGCFNGVFNASIYSDFIIAISDYSRNHFLETFPHYPAGRVRTIYPGSRLQLSPELPKPARLSVLYRHKFWLSVGILEPRKNHQGLLSAYASLEPDSGGPFPLVLAGGKGWLMNDFQKELKSLNLQDRVILLGYVDDAMLQWLYQNCFAFVYPSYYEGFGLPVLEAMSCGAAVITSKTSSLPEVGGDVALYVDPNSKEDLADKMRYLVLNSSLVEELRMKSLKQASNFSWDAAAEKTLQIYEETFKEKPWYEK